MPSLHALTGMPIAEIGERYGAATIVDWALPEGYINSREMFCLVLARIWGSRADGDFDHTDDDLCVAIPDRLRCFEHHLHWLDATRVIRSAALAGEFEMLVEVDGSLKRLTRDRWQVGEDEFWESCLFKTEISFIAPADLKDLKGGRLCCPVNAARKWIQSLPSEFALPDPLERDPNQLSEGPCYLHRAACWLAGQPEKGLYEFSEERADLRGLLNTFDEAGPDQARFCEEEIRPIAVGLSRLAVVGDACKELLDAAKRGDLTIMAWSDPAVDNVKIETASLNKAVRLDPLENVIVPAGNISESELQKAIDMRVWKDVNFFRNELIKIWGRVTSNSTQKQLKAESGQLKYKAAGLPARRPKMKEARAYFEHLLESWTPGEPHLKRDEFTDLFRKDYDLSRDEAREFWGETPNEWRNRGRPPKRKAAKKCGEN